MLFELYRLRHDRPERIHRKIDIGGPRLAALPKRAGNRFIELRRDKSCFAHGSRITRDRADQMSGIKVLQTSTIFLCSRIAARENQDGGTGYVRVSNPRDGI